MRSRIGRIGRTIRHLVSSRAAGSDELADALLVAARRARATGEKARAADLYRHAAARRGPDPSVWFEYARELVETGSGRAALEAVKTVLDLDPGHLGAYELHRDLEAYQGSDEYHRRRRGEVDAKFLESVRARPDRAVGAYEHLVAIGDTRSLDVLVMAGDAGRTLAELDATARGDSTDGALGEQAKIAEVPPPLLVRVAVARGRDDLARAVLAELPPDEYPVGALASAVRRSIRDDLFDRAGWLLDAILVAKPEDRWARDKRQEVEHRLASRQGETVPDLPRPAFLSELFDAEVSRRQAIGQGYVETEKDAADWKGLLAGRLRLPPHDEVVIGSDPDWLLDANGQDNWKFQFHALRWLDLARRQAARGDDRAMALWFSYAKSWIDANPVENPPTKWAWADMADGLRARTFSYALPYLPDDQARVIANSLREHIEWLSDEAHIHHGNHALHQYIGLFVASSVLRDVAGQSLAVDRLRAHLRQSYDEDGVNEEASLSYQVMNFRLWAEVRHRFELEGLGTGQEFERLARASNFLAHATRPDGTLERIGDTDNGTAQSVGGTETNYVTSRGTSGSPPGERVRAFSAGYVFGRSGWGQGGTEFAREGFFSLRFGHQRAIHGHPDGGSFTYWAKGENWVTDTGRFAYDKSAMRRYVVSRAGQNNVEVRGRTYDRSTVVELADESHVGALHSFLIKDNGYAGVSLTRLVAFHEELEWLLVQDTVSADGEVEARSHIHHGAAVTVDVKDELLNLRSNDESLQVLLLHDVPEVAVHKGKEKPPRGWLATGWRRRVAAPETILTLRGRDLLTAQLFLPDECGDAWRTSVERVDGETIVFATRAPTAVRRFRLGRQTITEVETSVSETGASLGKED